MLPKGTERYVLKVQKSRGTNRPRRSATWKYGYKSEVPERFLRHMLRSGDGSGLASRSLTLLFVNGTLVAVYNRAQKKSNTACVCKYAIRKSQREIALRRGTEVKRGKKPGFALGSLFQVSRWPSSRGTTSAFSSPRHLIAASRDSTRQYWRIWGLGGC